MPKVPTNNSIKSPLVSILVPCYNSAQFIAETLDSLLLQTYINWECIIVDDHSTDNSTETVQQYISKYPGKFQLIVNPRKGACAARNVAFEHSKGDYIQYLDADTPNKLEDQIKLFEQFGDQIIANCKWGRFKENIESVKWQQLLMDGISIEIIPFYEWALQVDSTKLL